MSGICLRPGIEKAFEQQVVTDRVEVDDAEAVGDAAAGGGTTPRPDSDLRLPGETDQVPHDEEVRREAHVSDDVQFELEPIDHLRRQRVAVALFRPLVRQVLEIGLRPLLIGGAGEAIGYGELGQARLPQFDLHVRPFGDQQRVVTRFRKIAEEVPHFGRRLQVVLGSLEFEAVGVREQRTGLHAEQRVVGHRIFAVGVVAVVGGQEGGADAPGDLDQLGIGAVLVGDPVVLDLDEQIALAEDVLEPGGPLLRFLVVAGQQRLEHHPAQATRGRDQALVMLREQFPVQSGLVVVALEVRGGGQLHQVAVALDRLGQKGEVVVELLAALDIAAGVVHPAPAHWALVARLARHVGLRADDGHDVLGPARLVEVQDPVHVPVVGDPERGLPVGCRGRYQIFDPRRTVEHGELGVGVQMRKRPLRHRPSFRHVRTYTGVVPPGPCNLSRPIPPVADREGRPIRPLCRGGSAASGPRGGTGSRATRPGAGRG